MKFRNECKQKINLSDMLQLKKRLSAVLKHDEHAKEDGCYTVKSLYFDNLYDKALREKCDGLWYREKFRIRYYNSDLSFIRLEKKSKFGGKSLKESTKITEREVSSLLRGDIDFLKQSKKPLFRELYAKMRFQLLRPKCIVKYTRESFVHPLGNVRITLDSEISGSNNVLEFLNPALPFANLYRLSILEVKWDEFLPQVVRDAVQLNSRKTTSFSKYAAARY